MRGLSTTIGLAAAAGLFAAGLLAALAAGPAQAGCTRSIINKSRATALVSRDGGPWVRVGPGRSQSIRYSQPGEIEVALTCGRAPRPGPPAEAAFRVRLDYNVAIDRCFIHIGRGFAEEYLGPGAIGTEDTTPLTVNVPRQGDVVIGPLLRDVCEPRGPGLFD